MVMPCPAQLTAVMESQATHQCRWLVRPYDGGPYRHTFRTCSYCGGMNAGDLIDLIERHGARLSGTTKSHKFYVEGVPNPIAGQRCRMGSTSGPVFGRGLGQTLVQRLRDPTLVESPTLSERLTRHYDRPIHAAAPDYCHAKFYMYHVESDEQTHRLHEALRLHP